MSMFTYQSSVCSDPVISLYGAIATPYMNFCYIWNRKLSKLINVCCAIILINNNHNFGGAEFLNSRMTCTSVVID